MVAPCRLTPREPQDPSECVQAQWALEAHIGRTQWLNFCQSLLSRVAWPIWQSTGHQLVPCVPLCWYYFGNTFGQDQHEQRCHCIPMSINMSAYSTSGALLSQAVSLLCVSCACHAGFIFRTHCLLQCSMGTCFNRQQQ
jgi:hypothetical protein